MGLPKIVIRTNQFYSETKTKTFLVNSINPPPTDDKIYMASEISHLIAKLMLDTSIYSDISRLFKITNPRNVKMVQIIILENLCDEELSRQKMISCSSGFGEYMEKRNYSEINFRTSSLWRSGGFEEFLSLPIKCLPVLQKSINVRSLYGDTSTCLKLLTPRILLSTPTELYWDNVPCPKHMYLERNSEYIFSQKFYECPDDDPMNILSIDCEMVNMGDANDLALARISVVRCAGEFDLRTIDGIRRWFKAGAPYEVVYDEKVLPEGTVVDYLTKYSGITKKSLENVTLSLKDVRDFLKTIIKPNTIIAAHSVQGDLKCLRLYHPYIIDTSTIYNTAGNVNLKPGLAVLAKDILKKEIRKKKPGAGHDSVEDAYTTLKLVLLKLQHNIDFGNQARIPYIVKSPNEMFGEWKTIVVNERKIVEETVVDVELCQLEYHQESEPATELDNIQKNIDKFILLTEQAAVVQIPELMFAKKKSLNVVVNGSGIVGQSVVKNGCKSVYHELSDDDVVARTVGIGDNNGMVIAVLSDYGEVNAGSDWEERCTHMTRLQDNVDIIVNTLPERSAALVILSGQNHCDSTGKLYWKIT